MRPEIPALALLSLCALIAGPSPSQAGSATLTAGKRIYGELCQSCHGVDGRGTGVMKFMPPAADLTSRHVQAKLDSGLYKSIHDGRANTAMGAWTYALSDEEIHDVISYVRTFGDAAPTR